MEIETTPAATAARYIDGSKFYPVHLTNEELDQILNSVLRVSGMESYSHYQVYLRKDKTSKGLDFRFQNCKGMYAPRYMLTFTLNPHWEIVDIFVNSDFTHAGNRFKTVDTFYSRKEEAVECLQIPLIDSIYVSRLKSRENFGRNDLFLRDDWVCLLEKQDALADHPYH